MASETNRWLLPDGVNEVLPDEARRVERLRRRVLDLFESWGYELVIPPLVEYLESLLTGSGSDLDLQTFKVTDQASGRQLGLRVDMTSQAARIDANVLREPGVSRLCYAGSVLRAKPLNQFENRCPMLIGAELFGSDALQADVEVIALMSEMLEVAQVSAPCIELGHIGVFRALAAAAGVDAATETRLFEAVQRKSDPDIQAALGDSKVTGPVGDALVALPGLVGGAGVLTEARQRFAAWPTVTAVLDEVERTVDRLPSLATGTVVQFDLSELRGYSYHTGLVLSAYTADQGRAFARGGRYDHIGEVFGRGRPATGFDADLLTLASYGSHVETSAIFAPTWDIEDDELIAQVNILRDAGEQVICGSAGDVHNAARCPRRLASVEGRWQVVRNSAD